MHPVIAMGTNWSAVSAITGITTAVIALVGKLLAGKLNAIGEHLAAQDKGKEGLMDRLSKLEGKVEALMRRKST